MIIFSHFPLSPFPTLTLSYFRTFAPSHFPTFHRFSTINPDSGELAIHSVVLQQLHGKQVLITGVTGFLGKVLLEKLLRAVPGIGGITLLIRGKGDSESAGERFRKEIASSSVFDRLRQEDPHHWQQFCAERIHCLTGEVTQPFLGLGEEGFFRLARNVDAVINAAASVNFRQELDKALDINVWCLRNLVQLVQRAHGLPLIHVSTSYVHGSRRGHIYEELTSPDPKRIESDPDGTYPVEGLLGYLQDRMQAVKNRYSGDRQREKLVDLGLAEAKRMGWNDAYTCTTWIGEQLLARELPEQPLTLLRPSIIESTWEEPVPGWVEGVKVADTIIMAYARGKVVFFPGRRAGIVDVIPADLVANSIVLSLAEQLQSPENRRIYQCCSGSQNPLTVGELIDYVVSEARSNHTSLERVFPYRPRLPFLAVNRQLFWMVGRGLSLPLRGVERGLQALNRPAGGRAVEHLRTTIKLAEVFGFYSCPKYVFHNSKLLDMASRMGEQDRALFPVDPAGIDWEHYIRKIHLPGLNRYALGQKRDH